MENINDLTEDCLIWLFGKFSLQELIELRKVCQLWAIIIEQICQRKKSLKLFRNVKAILIYLKHLFVFNLQSDPMMLLNPVGKDDELIGCCWKEVSSLFANVQHLVYYDSSEKLDDVLQAMPNITNLTLSKFEDENRNISQFVNKKSPKSIESLNQLTSLKHLHLVGNFLRTNNKFLDIEILSKLESFYLIDYYRDIIPILNQLGAPLRKLSFDAHVEFYKLEQLFKIKPEIFTKLTHLKFRSNNYSKITESKKLFHFICEKFQSLETFEFGSILLFKQDETIFSLAKLKHLTDLSVEKMWDFKNCLLTDKLEQITKFQVKFNEYDPETFPQIAVRSIFPNLESITVLARGEDFLKSTKIYLVDEQKLACKVNCDSIIPDSFIYMGRHRKQFEIEEKCRKKQEKKEAKERWLNKCRYDDYDPYNYIEAETSSDESSIDPYKDIDYDDYYNYDNDQYFDSD